MPFARRKPKHSAPAGRIQVSTYSGRPIVDPSEDTVRQLVLDLAGDPDELVVVASAADVQSTYVQVMVDSDGRCIVEAREGSEESHVHAFVDDLHVAADVMTTWAAGDPGWRQAVDWQEGYP